MASSSSLNTAFVSLRFIDFWIRKVQYRISCADEFRRGKLKIYHRMFAVSQDFVDIFYAHFLPRLNYCHENWKSLIFELIALIFILLQVISSKSFSDYFIFFNFILHCSRLLRLGTGEMIKPCDTLESIY